MVTILDVSYSTFKEAAGGLTNTYYFVTPALDGYILGTGNSEIIYTVKILNEANINDFINDLLPTAEEVYKEGDVLARPTLAQTGPLQTQYEIGDSIIYIGKARRGIATSAVGWTIQRFLLDTEGLVTEKKITYLNDAVWDNRASEIYR